MMQEQKINVRQKSLFNFIGLMVLFSALVACTPAENNIPAPTSRVMDNANLLSIPQKTMLIQRLGQIDRKEKVEIVILTVRKLGETSIEEFSNKVFNSWKIGKKGTDSGLLIVLSLDPKKFRVEVGRGNEGAIPDMMANRVMQDVMRPYLEKKDFYNAFDKGVTSLLELINKSKG